MTYNEAGLTPLQAKVLGILRAAGAKGMQRADWLAHRLKIVGTPTQTLRVLERHGLASCDGSAWRAVEHVAPRGAAEVIITDDAMAPTHANEKERASAWFYECLETQAEYNARWNRPADAPVTPPPPPEEE